MFRTYSVKATDAAAVRACLADAGLSVVESPDYLAFDWTTAVRQATESAHPTGVAVFMWTDAYAPDPLVRDLIVAAENTAQVDAMREAS